MTRLIGGRFRIKVALVLRGDALRPEFCTAYFGVSPDFSVRKGELSRSPNGKLRETPHFWGVWNYRCQSKNIATIDEGVMLLMKTLKMPRRDFKKALSETGCQAILTILVDNSDGKNPGIYGQITSDFLTSTGAELNLDVIDPY